ncbi:MAG: glycosyltransferase family 2 protein [Patescibacteria group bacterium]|nr:glycosyltransferase family 2 protein [Patescibacteria group bacterium]
MKIVAVIPAYNEEASITKVIEDIKPHIDAAVVVDDGSTDATAEVARTAGAVVLRHVINRGQGAALATGTEFTLRSLGADIIVHYDADGQHLAEEIDEMVKPIILGGADVALGSRFLGKKSNVPALRQLVLMGGIIFTRLTSGLRVTDTHNGFRALSREAAEKIKITQDRMAHASEILDEIGRNKLRYVEVPVTVKYTPESLAKGQRSLGSLKIVWDYLLNKFL